MRHAASCLLEIDRQILWLESVQDEGRRSAADQFLGGLPI